MTLEQLLTLAGRLDDDPGFDAPRERFRRFLGEYVNDAVTSRRLIEEAQNTPGEQHQRALQDLVANLGRVLQFEVTFGTPNPATGVAPYQGLWLSARSVVVLEVRSSRSAASVVDGLVRAVIAAKETVPSGTSVVGVTALVPLALSRRKVDDAIAASAGGAQVHALPVAALLSLADLVAAEHITHGDVVRLLAGNAPVDFIVGLVDRVVERARVVEKTAPEPANTPAPFANETTALTPASLSTVGVPVAANVARDPRIWLVSVAPEHATPPDDFLDTVVLRRQMFGISLVGAPDGDVRVGDTLCFYLDFKGIVGLARVDAILEGGGGLREARHFRQVLHLDRIDLHLGAPIRLDPETQVRLHAIPQVLGRRGQTLMALSPETFAALMMTKVARQAGEAADTSAESAEAANVDTDQQLTG